MNIEPVGKCSQCGKSSAWNSPAIDEMGNLWCSACLDKDRSGMLFREVNQHMKDGKYDFTGGVQLNGVAIQVYPSKPGEVPDMYAWVEHGRRSVPLTADERKMTPEALARLLDEEHNQNGLTRCTTCSKLMRESQIAAFPLFAGAVCADCKKIYDAQLADERARGYVCSRCRQPYSNCCC